MILITGGAGFIGSNLANELIEKGYEVVICDYKNKINKQYFNDFNSISDIINPEDLESFIIALFGTNSVTPEVAYLYDSFVTPLPLVIDSPLLFESDQLKKLHQDEIRLQYYYLL